MTETFYFAYGSNMNPERMKARKVRVLSAEPAKLYDYLLAFNKTSRLFPGSGVANIVSKEKGLVEGILYLLKGEKDLLTLDACEGVPEHYIRIDVLVNAANGTQKAISYQALPHKIDNQALPCREYLNHLLAGQPYLSESYFKKLSEQKLLKTTETFLTPKDSK